MPLPVGSQGSDYLRESHWHRVEVAFVGGQAGTREAGHSPVLTVLVRCTGTRTTATVPGTPLGEEAGSQALAQRYNQLGLVIDWRWMGIKVERKS